MGQQIGKGSKLEQGDGATPEVFTNTLGILNIDFGSNKIETVDNTVMNTPGTVRTFISGLQDPGDVSVKLNYIPGDASQIALYTARDAGLANNYQAIYPGAAQTVAFSGIITGIDDSIPLDKIPTISVKIKVTGQPTRTQGGS